jgi:hypothetical protein
MSRNGRHCVTLVAIASLWRAGLSSGADAASIDRTVSRGVRFLESQQERSTGLWAFNEDRVGASALAGLTLLECGVPASNEQLQHATRALRLASVSLTKTYSIALAIIYFNRLGEATDEPLVQSLALRLLAGQTSSGGWSYDCPGPAPSEQQKLLRLITNRRSTGGPSREPPLDFQQQVQSLPGPQAGPSDNSNTKFATLALWVARRHQVPTDSALRSVADRFRRSQNADGGWGYLSGGGDGMPPGRFHPGPRPPGPMRAHLNETLGSMTCSGLLGLAIGRGVTLVTEGASSSQDSSRPAPTDDPSVRAALLLLGQIVGGSLDAEEIAGVPLYNQVKGDVYYFLWSLERVAVAYDLSTIGGKEWYQWGSAWLVAKQTPAGGWSGRYGPGGVDTCFALLFLKRANLSRDLTVSLQGQVGDPADTTRYKNSRPPDRPAEAPPRTPDDTTRRPVTAKPPASDGEKSAETLRHALLHTAGANQRRLINEYRDHKGPAYTEALGEAIPQLGVELRGQARDALAERLTRMTSATLQGELQSTNAEVRRAAALASAMKEEQALVPDLIERLDDSDKAVRRAAAIALASLTKKNFGPSEEATPEERKSAIHKWRVWWSEQKR